MTLPASILTDNTQLAKMVLVEYESINGFNLLWAELVVSPNMRQVDCGCRVANCGEVGAVTWVSWWIQEI